MEPAPDDPPRRPSITKKEAQRFVAPIPIAAAVAQHSDSDAASSPLDSSSDASFALESPTAPWIVTPCTFSGTWLWARVYFFASLALRAAILSFRNCYFVLLYVNCISEIATAFLFVPFDFRLVFLAVLKRRLVRAGLIFWSF